VTHYLLFLLIHNVYTLRLPLCMTHSPAFTT